MAKQARPVGEDNIVLTPHATLRFACAEKNTPWQEKLFALGAARERNLGAAEQFWAGLAEACIRELCHAANPDDPSSTEAEALSLLPLPDEAGQWLALAPPMPGGEYLSHEVLGDIWEKLLSWCAAKVREKGGLSPFLRQAAPKWQQVGRVFFHLAENKLNTERPFVFLATYTAGFNASGRLRHTPLSQAVKFYTEQRNTQALRHLLKPVQLASEHFPWVSRMLETKALFAPRAWMPEQAYAFLKSASALEEDGIGVRLPDWWARRARPRVKVRVSRSSGTNASLSPLSLAHFDIGYAIGEEDLSEEELEKLLASAEDGLALFKGQWIEIDREKLNEVLEHWENVRAEAEAGNISYLDGIRMLSGLPGRKDKALDADELEDIDGWSFLEAGEGFKELLQAARGEVPLDAENIPDLHATLRPYQVYGVSWMRLLGRLGMGACLADDMGLGKTIQVLALLLSEKEREKGLPPSFLIVPASLLANWKAEAARFAPTLKIAIVHPSEQLLPRKLEDMPLKGLDLVITTYSMCTRLAWLKEVEWRRVILDEAQAIKNAQTRQSKSVRDLRATSRIAMTGTPIENRLSDLWSLFDFLNPGLLGTSRAFDKETKLMLEAPQGLAPLRRVTAPYILRRLKTDKSIISSLPDKIESNLYCSLTKEQAVFYQQVTDKIAEGLEQEDESSEGGRRMRMLQYIMLLKQICNHPAQAGLLAKSGSDYAAERSGKFKCIGDLCAEIASRQEKILVFTQFREIIDPLSDYLAGIFGRSGLVLHGNVAVKKRGELVREFQSEDGPPFFILSLKAGGTGLNLTHASHVIHFDRWWNPAVEDQATDRAFRIGQKNNVLVHKCITRGTIEEHIDEMIQEKRALADSALGNMENSITSLSDTEFLNLVRLDLKRALED